MRHGLICLSGQDWWYWSRAHSDFQLMLRAARREPVLFVNSIGMRMPLPGRSTQPLRRVARKARSVTRPLSRPVPDVPGFTVMTPVFLPAYASAAARRANARLVAAQVRRAARRIGLRAPACIVTLPTAWDVATQLEPAALVYNRSDLHSAFGEAHAPTIRRLERTMLAEADRVLYVSHELLAAERELTGDRAVFLDHGVDLDHFRVGAGDEPPELRAIPHPRIGFFGAFDDYLVDLDLLATVARRIPDASLVLVGAATCPMRALEALPNVHWLGHRPYEQIPAYGAAFDVALMPWLDNEWIRHANPIKLKEYLALGLPVVSTPFPELERYRAVVRVGATPDAFVAEVRAALADDDPTAPARRRAAVEGASWDRRTDELLAVCDEAVATRHRSQASPASGCEAPSDARSASNRGATSAT